MNFVDAVVAFLNIGIFSTLICRFTGANMAMLVFCALLYMGSEPMETVGIMLTYLVFMRLTIYTQKRKLNFKKLQVFKGMRVFVPVLLIVISLFLYPFAALAIFLLLFMVEILAQIKAEIPEDRQLSKGELTKYIVIGSLLTTVSMIAVKFIPAVVVLCTGRRCRPFPLRLRMVAGTGPRQTFRHLGYCHPALLHSSRSLRLRYGGLDG